MVDGKYVMKGNVSKWGKTASGKSYPVEFEYTPAKPNSIHNIRTTAETRAFNRAVSNLVGGGEVSADEIVSGDEKVAQTTAATPAKVVQTPTKAPAAARVMSQEEADAMEALT